jgi:bacterioferritin (cytochrome b1)
MYRRVRRYNPPMAPDEAMDVDAVLARLGEALVLQHRSPLQYSLAAGGIAGLAYQGLADRFFGYAEAELRDARLMVEKIVALGGEPPTGVAPMQWNLSADDAVDWLIESEREAVAAMHAVIPDTGQEPRSEALEHLAEHIILRKQTQIDFLLRARIADRES